MVLSWAESARSLCADVWDDAATFCGEALGTVVTAAAVILLLPVLWHFGLILLVWFAGAPFWVVLAMLTGLWPS